MIIKITIKRKPSKIGIFIRNKLKKIEEVIKNMAKKIKEKIESKESKLDLYMKENDISEDYLLGILTAMNPIVEDESEDELDDDIEISEPAEVDIPELTEAIINKIVDDKIEDALKVQRSIKAKKVKHTKQEPVQKINDYEVDV